MTDEELLWNEFTEFRKAVKANRVFPECDFINRLINELPKLVIEISEKSSLYRARVYKNNLKEEYFKWIRRIKEDSKNSEQYIGRLENILNKSMIEQKKGFMGYNSEDSFVNPNLQSIVSGRCNYINEQCLYVAEDEETAISELKPLINEKISVATIVNNVPLSLIDFRFDETDNLLKNIIALLFITSPTQEEYDAYLYTQVICSIVKKNEYDGIIYSSCQSRFKNNYAIFNFDKCQAVSSSIFEVEKIEYTTKLRE